MTDETITEDGYRDGAASNHRHRPRTTQRRHAATL